MPPHPLSFPPSSQSHLQGYYKRTPDYLPIVSREVVGCFKVAVVHSAYLVDLRLQASSGLVFWPPAKGFNGPVDDVVQFSYSIKQQGWFTHLPTHHQYCVMHLYLLVYIQWVKKISYYLQIHGNNYANNATKTMPPIH